MKGHWVRYDADELAWLHDNHTMPITDYHAAFVARFNRGDVTAANLHSLRKRKGWRTGRTGCFVPGQKSWNKGVPCAAGKGGNHPNARAHQFRQGQRQGVALKLYKPIGTERLSKEGYLERKIHDGMPLQSRWRAVHLLEWEAANGPVPEGHCLKCLDGNRQNTSPANWALIDRALLPRLAGGNRYRRKLAYDDASPEVRPAILTLAKVQHAARKARV